MKKMSCWALVGKRENFQSDRPGCRVHGITGLPWSPWRTVISYGPHLSDRDGRPVCTGTTRYMEDDGVRWPSTPCGSVTHVLTEVGCENCLEVSTEGNRYWRRMETAAASGVYCGCDFYVRGLTNSHEIHWSGGEKLCGSFPRGLLKVEKDHPSTWHRSSDGMIRHCTGWGARSDHETDDPGKVTCRTCLLKVLRELTAWGQNGFPGLPDNFPGLSEKDRSVL